MFCATDRRFGKLELVHDIDGLKIFARELSELTRIEENIMSEFLFPCFIRGDSRYSRAKGFSGFDEATNALKSF